MPTRAEFEAAAALFDSAGQQVGALASAIGATSSADVLVGGVLGQSVPEHIAHASESAHTSQRLIADAAATCYERAAIIAAYEAELALYDAAQATYEGAIGRWQSSYMSWLMDREGWVPHPGPEPVPPTKPAAPPPWAKVRRL